MSEERDTIFISYAYSDKHVAKRIADCLTSKNMKIWIDTEKIDWGDQIIAKINCGLSASFMGIIILSKNFFEREMPQLELNSMLVLAASMQFRILPLYHDLNHSYLDRRYPLLSNIHGERADLECDILVSKLDSMLKKVKETVNIPTIQPPTIQPQTVLTSAISEDTTNNAKQVHKNEMEGIFTELRRDTTKERKQATISKLRYYTDNKRIWKHSVTWEIISYLLESYTIDGLYVIEYMIKFCQKEYPDDLNSIIDNREVFLPRLLMLIKPGVDDRISGDSFRILTIIVDENTLSKYALAALKTAIDELNDAEYTDYIQKYVLYFERASKKNQEGLLDLMYELTLREGKIGTRARHLYEYFLKL